MKKKDSISDNHTSPDRHFERMARRTKAALVFMRDWEYIITGIIAFLALLLLIALSAVEIPGWRGDFVKAVGIVGACVVVSNVIICRGIYKDAKVNDGDDMDGNETENANASTTVPVSRKTDMVFICRVMRKFADDEERQHFYDLRNLGTDALRAWADCIEEEINIENHS